MEYKKYIRKPLLVEAVEITKENIAEVAKIIGELKSKGGVKFIAVDRRVVPVIGRAYVGWFLTKMDGNYRCYAPEVFDTIFANFAPSVTFTFSEEDDEEITVSSSTEIPLDVK